MKIEIGNVFPATIDGEGTVMDYVENEFIFVIKDEAWTPFELTALKSAKFTIDFVYKFDIAVFLLTVEDAIDTSDFIFNIHDNDYDDSLLNEFPVGSGFKTTLYLLDKANIVCGKKTVQLSNDMSNMIIDKLKVQQAVPYREDEFTCNLEGLQSAYEPFEMEPLALVSDTF